MLNKKGYTLLELVLVLTVSSIIFYSAFYFPTDLIRGHSDYSKISERVSDNHVLRKALILDLNNELIEKVDESTLMIGDKTYIFTDDVKRDSISLTINSYEFNVDGNVLEIYNDETSLKFIVGSSFSKETGDGQ